MMDTLNFDQAIEKIPSSTLFKNKIEGKTPSIYFPILNATYFNKPIITQLRRMYDKKFGYRYTDPCKDPLTKCLDVLEGGHSYTSISTIKLITTSWNCGTVMEFFSFPEYSHNSAKAKEMKREILVDQIGIIRLLEKWAPINEAYSLLHLTIYGEVVPAATDLNSSEKEQTIKIIEWLMSASLIDKKVKAFYDALNWLYSIDIDLPGTVFFYTSNVNPNWVWFSSKLLEGVPESIDVEKRFWQLIDICKHIERMGIDKIRFLKTFIMCMQDLRITKSFEYFTWRELIKLAEEKLSREMSCIYEKGVYHSILTCMRYMSKLSYVVESNGVARRTLGGTGFDGQFSHIYIIRDEDGTLRIHPNMKLYNQLGHDAILGEREGVLWDTLFFYRYFLMYLSWNNRFECPFEQKLRGFCERHLCKDCSIYKSLQEVRSFIETFKSVPVPSKLSEIIHREPLFSQMREIV